MFGIRPRRRTSATLATSQGAPRGRALHARFDLHPFPPARMRLKPQNHVIGTRGRWCATTAARPPARYVLQGSDTSWSGLKARTAAATAGRRRRNEAVIAHEFQESALRSSASGRRPAPHDSACPPQSLSRHQQRSQMGNASVQEVLDFVRRSAAVELTGIADAAGRDHAVRYQGAPRRRHVDLQLMPPADIRRSAPAMRLHQSVITAYEAMGGRDDHIAGEMTRCPTAATGACHPRRMVTDDGPDAPEIPQKCSIRFFTTKAQGSGLGSPSSANRRRPRRTSRSADREGQADDRLTFPFRRQELTN